MELVVFPQVFDRCRAWLEEQRVVLACGSWRQGEKTAHPGFSQMSCCLLDEGVIQLQLAGKQEELVSLQAALKGRAGHKTCDFKQQEAKPAGSSQQIPNGGPRSRSLQEEGGNISNLPSG